MDASTVTGRFVTFAKRQSREQDVPQRVKDAVDAVTYELKEAAKDESDDDDEGNNNTDSAVAAETPAAKLKMTLERVLIRDDDEEGGDKNSQLTELLCSTLDDGEGPFQEDEAAAVASMANAFRAREPETSTKNCSTAVTPSSTRSSSNEDLSKMLEKDPENDYGHGNYDPTDESNRYHNNPQGKVVVPQPPKKLLDLTASDHLTESYMMLLNSSHEMLDFYRGVTPKRFFKDDYDDSVVDTRATAKTGAEDPKTERGEPTSVTTTPADGGEPSTDNEDGDSILLHFDDVKARIADHSPKDLSSDVALRTFFPSTSGKPAGTSSLQEHHLPSDYMSPCEAWWLSQDALAMRNLHELIKLYLLMFSIELYPGFVPMRKFPDKPLDTDTRRVLLCIADMLDSLQQADKGDELRQMVTQV